MAIGVISMSLGTARSTIAYYCSEVIVRTRLDKEKRKEFVVIAF